MSVPKEVLTPERVKEMLNGLKEKCNIIIRYYLELIRDTYFKGEIYYPYLNDIINKITDPSYVYNKQDKKDLEEILKNQLDIKFSEWYFDANEEIFNPMIYIYDDLKESNQISPEGIALVENIMKIDYFAIDKYYYTSIGKFIDLIFNAYSSFTKIKRLMEERQQSSPYLFY